MKTKWLLVAHILLAASAAMADPAKVTVGIASSISDAPILIAEKKGYFRNEDLQVDAQTFNSASNMVAPLGAGQLDVGAGAPSAALYNAVARGIKLKIVADKGSSQPGYGVNRIIVRKAHVDSGRYKTPADLKGMKIALAGTGVSSMTTLKDTLSSFGLKYSDVQIADLAFPQHVIALQNGAIDASITTDPSAAIAIREGIAVKVKGDDEVLPGHQVAVLLYSEAFATQQRQVAVRFMRAYVRAVRFYNGALKDGHFAGPNADELIRILVESTAIKDPALFRQITPVGNDPNGRVNVPSLKHDLEFYEEQHLINGSVDIDDVVDASFVEAAVKSLGPWKPN